MSSDRAVVRAATAGRMPRGIGLIISLLAASGYALTLVAFYPGYLTTDAAFVYGFMQAGMYGDWQSPVMSILWGLIDPIAPGSGSMFLLVATLYWLGFALVAVATARRSALIGIMVPLLALAPSAFFLLAMIWRDMLFATVWLVAAALVYSGATTSALIQRLTQLIPRDLN